MDSLGNLNKSIINIAVMIITVHWNVMRYMVVTLSVRQPPHYLSHPVQVLSMTQFHEFASLTKAATSLLQLATDF